MRPRTRCCALLFLSNLSNLGRLVGLVSVVSLVSMTAPVSSLYARDLQGRLGVGYNSEFANSSATNGVPGISFKYALSREMATELVIGLSTSTPGNSVTAIKGFRNIFFETNLNFYVMAGGGLLSANGKSGLEFMAGLGAEAFIPGLESLGFSMETGGSFNNISGNFVLQTIGASFLNAGIHFYF